ncbi:MAG: efflux RND transporter periplasmic adaptor subunit [Deltaproteobacteria bacterium]
MNRVFKLFWVVFVIVFVPIVMSCTSGPKLRVPPPPKVTVSHPLQKKITDYAVFSGQTTALEAADVRARVEGWLQKMEFEPGSEVKEGDLLFEIDPRPYAAQVAQFEALLMGKKADLTLARTNLERSRQLLAKAAVSQLQYDQDNAKALVAKAQVGIAEANLQKAQLDLSYTKVTAPISGTVSRNYVDIGNLVGAKDKTLLTKIVDTSKIYFYFDVSERDYLQFRRVLVQTAGKDKADDRTVHLQLADESGFPHKGTIDFAEPSLDPGTGTLRARAIFNNSNDILTGGLFGRVRMPLRTREALLVPDLAIGIAQAGRYVMVVNKENVAVQRPVETGALRGTLRVIEKGLSKEDWVVVNGIQRAQPGRRVNPEQKPISEDSGARADDAASNAGKAKKAEKKRTDTQDTSR